jgi:hypothetical protein
MEPTLTGYGCDGSGSISADRALTERQFRQEKQHANRRQYLHNENIRRHGLNWFRLPQSMKRCAKFFRSLLKASLTSNRFYETGSKDKVESPAHSVVTNLSTYCNFFHSHES